MMKLEGMYKGSLYGSRCRSLHAEHGDLDFFEFARLPNAGYRSKSFRRILQTNCLTKALLHRLFGAFPITNFWKVDSDQLYATRGNRLFRSIDDGTSWAAIRHLPSSSGPMGILPTGFCKYNGIIYIGEYPLKNSENPGVFRSSNGGDSWMMVTRPSVRHIHAVTIDPYTNDLWITTGDSDDQSMIARIKNDTLDVLGTGSQVWRAVDLAFTPDAVLWGMDCPYASENRIVSVSRNQLESNEPIVDTLHSVSSPVYYNETIQIDGESHVFFSTAIEPATAPIHTAQIIHGSSKDNFENWQTIATYERNISPLNRFVSTNSYVFLAADPERGLFYNPYNTKTDNGSIYNMSVNQIQNIQD